jgi:7,8-dihydroneopterin aldolase/epimerase/oxygenase
MTTSEPTTLPTDTIIIQGLELPVQIGVPDEERAGWQTLRTDLELGLMGRVEAFGDDLSQTVDYDSVAKQVRALASERPRRLIETLAGEIATALLETRAISSVKVTLKKRILPGVDYVAVTINRAK